MLEINARLRDFKLFIDKLYKYRTISIIGMEKNTGKTTTLNFLIQQLKGRKIGITSVGRDGEEEDIVTLTPKPKIYIDENTLIATSKSSFLRSDSTLKILQVMDINTPLGPVIIGESIYSGFVEIAGPSINTQIKAVIEKLKEFKCQHIIVDGALSKKSFADPSITEASILCTGAAFSEDVNVLVEDTLNVLNLFSLDAVEYNISKIYEDNMEDCRIAFIYGNNIKKSVLKTSISASKEIISNFNKDLDFVFIKGAFTNNLVDDMIKSNLNLKSVTFVVEDGTKLLLDKNRYTEFIYKGGKLKVKNNINIIGISVNPTSPSGYVLDYNEFFNRLKEETDIPVFNVMDYALDVRK
ncbi:hypothetical protein CPAST_c31470 [Clostridium pasteurianum DSM 525 = ATCC 6013]|uniref:Uncharacterized protein n=1 Tax=Clostridium pasteurianum DSM 525 = ATCC 6013 TaxID=1262449 RepID=A0A0H3JA38_CLOPA|nr:hypothetical protein [Clostridium pasteurianum]AJA49213.1 hypothetical protein CPAST_c31470 [Clostridium pasteurianum DSM 525 = ATCC 6013]AJA53201.1 hypothetical protein CLPA_c31470 [Clostridium pasteurianum DSM 525 = ATCC 6013]AOZ76395.1 hypothetical protein AQ983_15275 [Clostridium pasteurianum DSM 525 = ATCC 6013]AOZ80192.1 hypothetical protein AQ984_15270 [Clostridium pasteurianum]ELP59146.1 hypothetical protein F502_11691 [Clostridium pasteurianum DSM 525 = ATCC 6013]